MPLDHSATLPLLSPSPSPSPTSPLDHSATPPLLSPAQISSIIDATTNPDLSFRAIARAHGISVETLAILLDRPDIRERIATIDSSISRRTQSLATASLPSVVKALTRAVDDYLQDEDRTDESSPASTEDQAGGRNSARPEGVSRFAYIEQRRRATETMRRASWLLSRLSRLPAPPRPPRDLNSPPRTKTQGFLSLGPAPADTRAPTPTDHHIDEPSAPGRPTRTAPITPSPVPTPSPSHAVTPSLPLPPSRDHFPTPPLLSRIPASSSTLPLDHFATLPLLSPASRLIAAVGTTTRGPAP